MSLFFQGSLVAMGVGGAALAGMYVYKAHYEVRPRYDNSRLVTLAALTLSSSMVNETLHDEALLDELATFGLKVLKHPDTVQGLKDFFKKELAAEPTPSQRSLKKFIVDSVIRDQWVMDELLDLVADLVGCVKADETLYPKRILGAFLGGAALEALKTKTFLSAVKKNLKPSLWMALVGPPPRSLLFNPPFALPIFIERTKKRQRKKRSAIKAHFDNNKYTRVF